MTISAVVTTWNCQKTVLRCVHSLREAGIDQIYVADCGSTDGTPELFGRELVCTAAPSFGAARNAGLRAAAEQFVLFIDGDWVCDSTCLRSLMDCVAADPSRAIAIPRYIDDAGNYHTGHNVRRFPTAKALCIEFLMLHKLLSASPETCDYRMLDFDHSTDRDIDHPCSPFFLSRREALLAAGSYDESISSAWIEDIDLAHRLESAGLRRRFSSKSLAVHMGRETLRHHYIEAHYDEYYGSVLAYCRKYLPESFDLLRRSLIVGMALKTGFSYAVPKVLRAKLLRHYGLYNDDAEIQSYRHMYVRTLRKAIEACEGA